MNIESLNIKETYPNNMHMITSFNYNSILDNDSNRNEIDKLLYKVGDLWEDRRTLFNAIKPKL